MKPRLSILLLAFCGLSISCNCIISSAQEPLPKYELGKIPSQSVWVGSSRAFEVIGGPFTMMVDTQPMGVTQLLRDIEGKWTFRYTPDIADIDPFKVTITAVGKSQTFLVTPKPDLPPERSFFPTQKHTQAAVSTYEISVVDEQTALREPLNLQTNFLHNVQIIGETVEIESRHANGLYEAYANRGDIKSMELIAEKVVVRSPLRLKQTAVTIRARELVFEANGKILTTPEENLAPALSNDLIGGFDGTNGLPGGDVVLRVANFSNATTNQIVFDLTGGHGQPGGRGRHGANGASVPVIPSPVVVDDYDFLSGKPAIIRYTPTAPAQVTYWYLHAFGIDESDGTTTRPGNGGPARPSGTPGLGGGGGSLRTTIVVGEAVKLIGGASAAPTFPSTPPLDKYTGGTGGNPRRSMHVDFTSYRGLLGPYIEATKEVGYNTTNGANAEVRIASAEFGPAGNVVQQDLQFSWVDPLWLRKVLNHVQSDYLGGNIAAAEARLQEYEDIFSKFKKSPEWSALDTKTQLELNQISNEIEILLQRIQANLDYFGNPAGWVPMLSFEVTKNIFESEIDSAIETLYLAYWIGNKARTNQQYVNALSAARDQLRDDLEQARIDYAAAVENLPTLDAKAADLQTRIRTTQNSLAFEEEALLDEVRGPAWANELRLGLKVAATVCQIVPVGQPALYAVGQGVRVASDFDPDRPWSSITNAQTISMAYTNSPFKSSAETNKTSQAQIDPAKAQTNSVSYVTMLQQSSVGLQAGVKDIQGFMASQTSPTPEMLAELEELKSKSPSYKKLIEQVESLMEENGKFAEELITTMQRISTLSDVITQNLLAIDALNIEIAPAVTVLDERATIYLEDMKRRSLDRLLKYHYYMAKAYEYRLLKPYTQPLNLEGLFQKFEEIADLNSHNITPEQFTTLRQVYQSLVADVAESIYDEYVSNRPQLSVPIRFNLTDEELATLNVGGVVTLNPNDRGLFPVVHENVRIVDLKVFAMTTEAEGGYGSSAYVDLTIAHSGISHLKQDGKLLIFRHYNQQTQNPIVWGGRYDPVDNRIDNIRPSDASDSLLRSLLSGPATGDMLLYSRPSGWADLLITRAYFNSNGRKINIKSARLELTYDFIRRNEGLGLHTLEVAAAGVGLPGVASVGKKVAAAATAPLILESGMQPLFTLDKTDVNDRRHARGQFIRVYPAGAGAIHVTAPETYGEWRFYQWTDKFGNPLPTANSPSVTLNMNEDVAVLAQYILPAPLPPTLQLPAFLNGNVTIRWSGGGGIVLQSASALTGSWQDVPGTDGISEISIPAGKPSIFYRAAQK